MFWDAEPRRIRTHSMLSTWRSRRRPRDGQRPDLSKICRAESCQSMNGEALCTHAKASLRTGFGETTADGSVTLEAVYCLGNCALSPAMMVDGQLHGRVDANRFDAILAETLNEAAQ